MTAKHQWNFKSHFRASSYGWKGSSLAIRRLKEAVSEIKKVSRSDAVTAADGAVALFERFWPALQQVDSSSGALGSAVNWTQQELLPLVIAAPADRKTRDKWLDRLWQAIEDDGVDYLWMVQDQWGELCASPAIASQWADRLTGAVRTAWSDPRPTAYAKGASVCLSSLLAAGRHQDLWDLLAVERFPFWPDRKFGVDALLKEGRIDEALAYAEATRRLNQPNMSIDAACERILLDAGRSAEAYQRYALTASESSTGLATFRAVCRKYPSRDPRTLSRAARDFAGKQPEFAFQVGRLALGRLLQGFGYEVTSLDVLDAYQHLVAAAERLGVAESAKRDAIALANQAKAGRPDPLADALLRTIGVT